MAAVQLSFNLRTSPNCKTVHLIGNWDGYKGQLPLSKDSSRSGTWKGTFRFQGSTLRQGGRYWYYYIIDGYHVSHDPAKPYTTEPTTGRNLNILDVPQQNKAPPSTKYTRDPSPRRPSTNTRDYRNPLPKGRPISPSRIVSPQPLHPATTRLTTAEYTRHPDLASLSRKFAAARLDTPPSASSFSSSSEEGSEFEEDSDSDVPSLGSSRTSACSSPGGLGYELREPRKSETGSGQSPRESGKSSGGSGRSSGGSSRSSGGGGRSSRESGRSSSGSGRSSVCSCERYGITRKGTRVRLDCGGSRCGYSDGELSCSSSDSEGERYRMPQTRRQGVVVRGMRR